MTDAAEKDRHGVGTVRRRIASPDARALLVCSVAGSMPGQAAGWSRTHTGSGCRHGWVRSLSVQPPPWQESPGFAVVPRKAQSPCSALWLVQIGSCDPPLANHWPEAAVFFLLNSVQVPTAEARGGAASFRFLWTLGVWLPDRRVVCYDGTGRDAWEHAGIQLLQVLLPFFIIRCSLFYSVVPLA